MKDKKKGINVFFGFLVVFIVCISFRFDDFIERQKTFPKVIQAFQEKEFATKLFLNNRGLDEKSINLILCAFKKEKELVVFVKNKSANKYQKLISYPICQSSGTLGPKRKQGDGQVPEGFYFIHHFNPTSNYYLSLGVSYPNKSDRIRKTAKDAGGAIYIHGDCVTIGCLPITDDKIKELYVLSLMAYQAGQQKIPVYIFPCHLTDENLSKLSRQYNNQMDLISFWRNIKIGYDLFFKNFSELDYSVNERGDYVFNYTR